MRLKALEKHTGRTYALVTYGVSRASARTAINVLGRTAMFLVLAPALVAHADTSRQHVCTNTQARQAEAEAGQLKDWNSVYRSFKRFAHCDEGTIAEQYSDSVSHLLANDWKHLDALLRLTLSDSNFEQFVIRHIDESMTEDEANLIINNARLHCPTGAKRLCKSIVDY